MSDSEYEEEEILVFADFRNQLLETQLNDEKAAIKIIGLDEANPIAEISGCVFKGSYDFAVGTNVFFVKDPDAPKGDALFEETCDQKYKYLAKTNKVIKFERIFLESVHPESNEVDLSEGNELSPEDLAGAEKLKLNMTYEEALQLFPAHVETTKSETN